MSASNLKLVNDETEAEIAAAHKEIQAAKRTNALARIGGGKTADVLPPDLGAPRYDDISNAERFLSIVGSDVLYIREAKRWVIWKQTRGKFEMRLVSVWRRIRKV